MYVGKTSLQPVSKYCLLREGYKVQVATISKIKLTDLAMGVRGVGIRTKVVIETKVRLQQRLPEGAGASKL
jgi:hypothetical protein